MVFAYIHVYVAPVDSEGLPWWSIVPLTLLGIALGYGVIYAAIWLWRIPRRRRDHAQHQRVAAALAGHPVYDVAAVIQATDALFARFWPAWSKGARATLQQLGTPSVVAGWDNGLGRMAQKGRWERVSLRRRPRYEVIGARILPQRDIEFATIRVRTWLRAHVELRSGGRRPFPGTWCLPWWRYDYCWTMTHADGTWRVSEIRTTDYATDHGWGRELEIAPAGGADAAAAAAGPAAASASGAATA